MLNSNLFTMNKRIIILIAIISIILITGTILIVKTCNAPGISNESEEDEDEKWYLESLISAGYPDSIWGIEIEETELEDKYLAALMLKEDGNPIIQVGNQFFLLSYMEKRWVLSHELGHWVLGHLGDRIDIDEDIREFEADLFAHAWAGGEPFEFSFGTDYTRRLGSQDDEEYLKWSNLYLDIMPDILQKSSDFGNKCRASLE